MDEKANNRLKGIQTSLRIVGLDISDENLRQIYARHREAKVPALMESMCCRVDAEVQRTGQNAYEILRRFSERLLPKLNRD